MGGCIDQLLSHSQIIKSELDWFIERRPFCHLPTLCQPSYQMAELSTHHFNVVTVTNEDVFKHPGIHSSNPKVLLGHMPYC